MCLCIDHRNKDNNKDNQYGFIMLCKKARKLFRFLQDDSMLPLLNIFIKQHQQGRQDDNGGQYPEDNTLCHYDTDILSQGQLHRTQCQKTCDRCYRGACNGGEGCLNCIGHRLITITAFLFFLLIAVQQEDRIIHGDTQLQYKCQCLRNIGYLS